MFHKDCQSAMVRGTVLLSVVLMFTTSTVEAQTSDDIASLVASQKFKDAIDFLKRDYDRFIQELIYLTEIPAPPLKEHERASAYLELLRGHALQDVEMDAEGNVLGVRRGTVGGPMLAVLAHLDTVFPEGTDVTVRLEGTRLMAPGIGDDARALALVLALIRAMNAADIQTAGDILFVGTVGEEGIGELRGTKYLLSEGRYRDRIGGVISIDETNDAENEWKILNVAVGSIRYRALFRGPGGHSFNAFGLVNPANAMADTITRLSRIEVPSKPKTTFNVGVVGGGTSVNAIPAEVWMEVDLRSESSAELARLDEQFRARMGDAIDTENERASTAAGRIEVELKVIGNRPAGETPLSSSLVQTTSAAVTAFGLTPTYGAASTDSNIPMSMGIPAISIARGLGGRAHSLDEWTDINEKSVNLAASVVLAALLGAAALGDEKPLGP